MLHLVGCLYYLYQWCTVKQISDNEIYLLIKYIKNVLWRVAKCLSYIDEARCLKVNNLRILQFVCISLTIKFLTSRSIFIEELRSLVVCNFNHGLEHVFLCIVYNARLFIRAGDATNNLGSSVKTKYLLTFLPQVATSVFSRK